MAKPIEHSTLNAAATTGWKAGKWAFLATAVAVALPFVLGIGTIAAVGALIGTHLFAAAAVGAIGGLATLASTAGWGALPWIAGGGAAVGAFRGISRVSAENAAYKNKVQNVAELRQHTQETQVNNAGMVGMQRGYIQGSHEGQEMGFRKGQEYVINQLRAAQEQMMMQQQMGGPVASAQGKKGFADKLAEQRAAQAVNVTQQVVC